MFEFLSMVQNTRALDIVRLRCLQHLYSTLTSFSCRNKISHHNDATLAIHAINTILHPHCSISKAFTPWAMSQHEKIKVQGSVQSARHLGVYFVNSSSPGVLKHMLWNGNDIAIQMQCQIPINVYFNCWIAILPTMSIDFVWSYSCAGAIADQSSIVLCFSQSF